MTHLPEYIHQIKAAEYPYAYSICTLVTREEEYLEMLNTFIKAGFTKDDCEFLVINNSVDNKMDAFEGLNAFLKKAQGKHIIICHQDILLTEFSTRKILDDRIADISIKDAQWAVLGNAGAAPRLYKPMSIKIAYPDNTIDVSGKRPEKVTSIDENFMVVKNSANLGLSGDVGGYHLYALDICMIAMLMGYHCYTIDFLLIHKSRGTVDKTFHDASARVQQKYTAFMSSRYVNTTITSFYVSGSETRNKLYNTWLFRKISKTSEKIVRLFAKRRLS